jgi:hypothetical protein
MPIKGPLSQRAEEITQRCAARVAMLQVRPLAARILLVVFFSAPIVLAGCGFAGTSSSPQNVPGTLQITTSSVPNGQVGVAYSTSLVASSGATPYGWSISAGALPGGLTLGANNGIISGTPTASGSFSFTAKVTDSTSPTKQTATNSFTITVAAAGTHLPAVTITAPPNGAILSGTVTLSATATSSSGASIAWVQFQINGTGVGGHLVTAPYSLSLNTGTLPNGTATIDAIAQDSAGNQGTSSTVTVTVNNSPVSGSTQTIYIAGSTTSVNFVTTDGSSCAGAPSTECPYFAILNRSGGQTTLVTSQILSTGSGTEGAWRDMFVDPATGDAIMVGSAGPGLPTTAGSIQPTIPVGNKSGNIICRFSSTGLKKFCTYFTTQNTFYENLYYGVAPALDANGNITVVGGFVMTAEPQVIAGVTGQEIGSPVVGGFAGVVAKIKGDGSAIVWFTLLGNAAFHNRHPMLDSSGNIYTTFAGTASTAGAWRTNPMSSANSAGVLKMAADGSHLIWATLTSGSKNLTGSDPTNPQTQSSDLPFGGVVLDSNNPPNVYFSTRIGGTDNFCGAQTGGNVGCTGGATGYMKSNPFTPSTLGSAVQATVCGIGEISADGSTMLHSTFLSGNAANLSNDNYPSWGRFGYPQYLTNCDDIDMMPNGNIAVLGTTNTNNFPVTVGAYKTTNTSINEEGYVAIFDPTLSNLVAATYIGGSLSQMQDSNYKFSFDPQGNLWNAFSTTSDDFPTTSDAYQTAYSPDCYDGTVYALNPALTSLVYGTYFGASSALANSGAEACSATFSFPGVQSHVAVVLTTGSN